MKTFRSFFFGLCALSACAVAVVASDASAQEAADKSVFIVPRVGFIVAGGGTSTNTCSGATCGVTGNVGYDYDDKSSVGLGVDVLAKVAPMIRVGGGLLWDPSSKASAFNVTQTYGSDLTINAIVEGVFPVAPKLDVIAHGQLGLFLLFPGGDLQNSIDSAKSACTGSCDVNGGPYKSFTFGLGGGAVYHATDLIGVRADLLYQQITSLDLLTTKTNGTETAQNISGHRFWLLLGVEFGL
jgi:opacity protein-like surface antigen